MLNPKLEIRAIAHEALKASNFYEEKPGAMSAETIVDLYRTITRLCRQIDRLDLPVGR